MSGIGPTLRIGEGCDSSLEGAVLRAVVEETHVYPDDYEHPSAAGTKFPVD